MLVSNSALYPNSGSGIGVSMAVDPYTGDIYAAHSATNTADDRLLKISSAGAITVLAAEGIVAGMQLAVPEPGRAVLLGLGLMGLVIRRRRPSLGTCPQ